MIQVYADGRLVADTRFQEYSLMGLTTTAGLNKSGTAILTMPPGHPAYEAFISHRTIVKIYEDGSRVFRGRALYPEDDFDNNRTITCEGERGFFRDTVMRPYAYKDTPAAIFRAIIDIHNAQTDWDKRFTVGAVTVSDPNENIVLESETAEQTGDTLDKLVDRCGGYIVFTETAEGVPLVHWLENLSHISKQVIEFGSNLLDFSRSGVSPDLATRLVPYGAKDEATGKRITIERVNGGLDYVQDNDAVALHGIICKPVFWDDVTNPSSLLIHARQELAKRKLVVESLELTAFDLSAMDKSLDAFNVGDLIRVRSIPHGVDDDFQLTDKKKNHLNPSDGKIVMGKEVASLTGAGAYANRKTTGAIRAIERRVSKLSTGNS